MPLANSLNIFNSVLCANTLNVFVKQKYARLDLLSILTRRGKTVFTPFSPFSGITPYAPVLTQNLNGLFHFLVSFGPDLARQGWC